MGGLVARFILFLKMKQEFTTFIVYLGKYL